MDFSKSTTNSKLTKCNLLTDISEVQFSKFRADCVGYEVGYEVVKSLETKSIGVR